MSIDGMAEFAAKWAEITRKLTEEKISQEHASSMEMREARLKPKSHYKTITQIETGATFAGVGRLVVAANGEVASAFLVNKELEIMMGKTFQGIELTSKERKTIKQRLQAQQLTAMSTLDHFGLFKVDPRESAGALGNDVNFYVITKKGRDVLEELEKPKGE